MSLWAELKRRHVIRIGIGYLAVAFVVLQVAVLLLPSFDLPSWTYDLILGLLILGFPVAIVLAWALTMTPEGQVTRIRTSHASESSLATAIPQPAAEPEHRSLAVLPFANLSADADNEYFSDGVTEEILMTLSKLNDLRVISRTSVMQFKGTSRKVGEIAADLGVAHVVEGSVRRSGDRVRITAQLIDARTDDHLWAESYDRDLEDIFAIQSEVAERIAGALRARLSPTEKASIDASPTADTKAYDRYLRGRHFLLRRTLESLQRSIELFDEAINADTTFARAWASRAEAWAVLSTDHPEGASQARESASRALELDPHLGEAYAVLGMVAEMDGHLEEAEERFRTALENAHGTSLPFHWYANFFIRRQRFDEGMALLRRALEMDPLSLPVHMGYGVALCYAGRYAEAERVLRRALEIDPEYAPANVNLAELYHDTGRYDEALDHFAAVSRKNPGRMPAALIEELRAGFEADGEQGYWLAWAAGANRHGSFYGREQYRAIALTHLGRYEEALDVLEGCITNIRWSAEMAVEPGLKPLHGHPRFQAMLQQRDMA